jgi:zinc finger protein 830
MADVRALLAAERSSRRLTHPDISYTKSGLIQCTVCHLNIRSESLWEGHLKSANHRKNASAALDAVPVSKKRKVEDDVDTLQRDEETRKKNKSVRIKGVPEGFFDAGLKGDGGVEAEASPVEEAEPDDPTITIDSGSRAEDPSALPSDGSAFQPVNPDADPSAPPAPAPPHTVDEDEWAAFERDLAPLTRSPPPALASTTTLYAATTISAPALSAAEIEAQKAQQSSSTRRDREAEAQDEKEESEARLQDEFAVMEEMEERVRKLREKREALRQPAVGVDIRQDEEEKEEDVKEPNRDEEEDDDDDDEVDDWFS